MSAAVSIRTTDPQYVKEPAASAFHKWAASLVLDERDVPFVKLIVQASVVMFPFAALLFWKFHWALAIAYVVVNLTVFVDRFILMLHNTSHRPLFKPAYRLWNHYIPWVLGPFFGETPETYFAHHLGMHHPENNLPDDLSSTMKFERDNLFHWLRYFGRFFFFGIVELTMYLVGKGRGKLARKCLSGEFLFFALVVGLSFVSWKATFTVFVVPFLFVRFAMMCGNWGQHAFIDAARPGNAYVNSITCINTRYNRRCFNDGYHIGHHIKSNRHWTEMPSDFEKNVARYAEEGAIVFDGIDFFQVWMFLMARRYDKLAAHYVNLSDQPKSKDSIVALLKERTRPIPVAVPEAKAA
ncbi:MAG: fatty acid desaturase [Polyangiaceae bacterium]